MPENVSEAAPKGKGSLVLTVEELMKKYSLLPEKRRKASVGEMEAKFKEAIRILLKKGYSRAEVIKIMKTDGVAISSKGLNKVFGRKIRKAMPGKGSSLAAK